MPSVRFILLPLVLAAAAGAACGAYGDPHDTPPPVVVTLASDSPPPVVQSPQCPTPDVTYFLVRDPAAAEGLARQVAAAQGIASAANQPFVPWAVAVGDYVLPPPITGNAALPPHPVSIQIVDVRN